MPNNEFIAQQAGARAEVIATNPAFAPDKRTLDRVQCWDAVKHLAMFEGIITERELQTIDAKTFVSFQCPHVRSRAEMIALPPGRVLGFFDRTTPPRNRIIHCMISIGRGRAAGAKNDALRPGGQAWEILDLAALQWHGDRVLTPLGVHQQAQQHGVYIEIKRALTIHYRPIWEYAQRGVLHI
jgi:hypothetical protein